MGGLTHWSTAEARAPSHVTQGLVDAIRDDVPEGAIVYGDPEASYRIAALAPVYVAVAPPGHVADTEENRPYDRIRDVRAFLRTGDLSVPRGYGADYVVVDRVRFPRLELELPVVYADERFTLYRLRPT